MSLDNPQNAEEYLLSAFAYVNGGGSLSDTGATVREALDRHARELAEQIRKGWDETFGATQASKVMEFAADLIDPGA